MSREFATDEIIRQKCSICGSKNKLYTQITYKGVQYGYMLTCCNCGHVDTFMDSYKSPAGTVEGQLQNGYEVCIQLTTCKNTKCKYYNTSTLWNSKTTIDSILNQDKNNSNDCQHCHCNHTEKDNLCNNHKCNSSNSCEALSRKSDSYQLDINTIFNKKPRFH